MTAEGYVLGIDLGTTYSAAAIARGQRVEPFVLGTIAAQVPSVVVHRADGEILTGEAAERRAGAEPTRAAREFKRRLGDPVPIIVGGTPYGAESLMAQMLAGIVGQVTEREGAAPSTIVLTHPANYSDYKRGLLHEAARLAGLDLAHVRLITEPEAAAIAYAHHERIDDGEVIAVYDFGGGTFDAAVVRGAADGFQLIGTPEGMERLGGIDIDQAVLAHVDTALDGMVSSADASDPNVVAGQARLRDECRRAKEALSSDTDATIPVSIPGVQTEVRLTRDELEHMVRPRIAETVTALQRTIASAGIATEDVSRVLLVGGSSRMPIVAQTVRELIGRPVSVDADPKLSIAIGAALSASAPVALPSVVAPVETAAPKPAARPSGRRGRRPILIGAALAAAVVGAVVVIATNKHDAPADTAPIVTTPASGAPTSGSVTEASSATSDAPQESSPSNDGIEVLATGVPGSIVQMAAGADGAVYVATADSALLRVQDGQAAAFDGLAAADGPAGGVAVASDGTVFVTMSTGVVSLDDGVATRVLDAAAAGLSAQLGPLAIDGGGNLYIADNGTARIVRLAPDGSLTLVAGTGHVVVPGSVPVDGRPAAVTDIGQVTGLVIDAGGRLLFADAGLLRIRSVGADGSITTVAGGGAVDATTASQSGATQGTELAFVSVDSMTVDADRRVFVVDAGARAVVRIDPDGLVHLIDTSPAGAQPAVARVVTMSTSGALVVTDGSAVWSIGRAA